jgi:hypothetical protein
MDRPFSTFRILLCAAALALPIFAAAQSSFPGEVTIAMTISASPTASPEDVRRGLQAVVAQMRKQPGAIDDVILENVLRTGPPTHLLIMRWRRLADWEAMLSNAEAWKTTAQYRALFTLNRTAVFQPLR